MTKPLIFLLLCFFYLSIPLAQAKYKEPTPPEMIAAKENFNFRGKWIHPKIIKDFMPWLSDSNIPMVVAIDIAAAYDSNRYFGEVALSKVAQNTPTYNEEGGQSFSYEWMGRLKNGMHVLLTREGGGGTMVATNLAIFTVRDFLATNGEGHPYRQLRLELERLITLGDRALPKIVIHENKIDIDVDFNNKNPSKRLRIEFK